MIRFTTKAALLTAAMSVASVVAAQSAPLEPVPDAPRARGPGMALAAEAAQAASASCEAKGYRVTVLVVDAASVAVVMMSADGAKGKSTTGVPQKAAAAIRYNMSSADVATRAAADPSLAAEIKADPKIVSARQGALLLKSGAETVGAIAVSGGPGGDKDEACAQDGINKILDRLQTVGAGYMPTQAASPPAKHEPVADLTALAIPGVVAAGTKVQFLRGGFVNVEGVIAMPDGSVLFCEQDANKIHRIAPDLSISTYLENTNRTTGLGYDPKGRLIGAQSKDPRIAELVPTRVTLADSFEGQRLVKPNDLVIDRRGGIYFTDPTPLPATTAGEGARRSAIFYITPVGVITKLTDYVTKPNGIQLSPDGHTLYATNGDHIVAFDVQQDGSVRNPRRFAEVTGDGLAMDSAGRLYVAINATVDTGIAVVSAKGSLLGRIAAPGRIQSIAFGGKGRKTLIAVGHSSVYKIAMLSEGVRGRQK